MTIIQQFKKMTKLLPDKYAIEKGEEKISFVELDKKSNQAANFFLRNQNKINKIVILMDSNPELISIILGIMKSGNIFIPINPGLPINRIELMIKEIQADTAIIDIKYYNKVKNCNFLNHLNYFIYCNENIQRDIKLSDFHFYNINEEKVDLIDNNSLDNCYIYFTSGSTGKPKAILGREESLYHFINWEITEFNIDNNFRCSQLTNISFDPFLRDIFVPLCSGGTICIPSEVDIFNWIEFNNISMIHIVPSLFRLFINSVVEPEKLLNLKYIFLAGEVLKGNDIKNFYKKFGDDIQLINLYGPTETTLAKTYYRITKKDINKINIPIGRPINETKILLLDKNLQLVKDGEIGEIYIQTPYMSNGYYNNEILTNQVFKKNPYSDNVIEKIYKTGDLGKLSPDGNIEYLGRLDNQVKIRGIRVEPGEIENVILKNNNIEAVFVTANENELNEKILCAYIVLKDKNIDLNIQLIKSYLGNELPEYMIPLYYIILSELPLTPNGKIDRKALPVPEINLLRENEYIPPVNNTEEKLVKIWQEIFNATRIGINDNFIELGGNSLTVMNLALKIHKEFDVKIKFLDLFQNETINLQAKLILNNKRNIFKSIPHAENKDYYEASSAQKRIYLLHQIQGDHLAYNNPLILEIIGKLDKVKIENAIYKIIHRHESLRTSFILKNGILYQKISNNPDIVFEYIDCLYKNDYEMRIDNFIRKFDLNKPQLIRVCLIKIDNCKHILVFDIHHIIDDGVSTAILLNDFKTIYLDKELSILPLQYKDYSEWQKNYYKNSEIFKDQESFWLNEFNEDLPILNLPYDFPRPGIQTFEGDKIFINLGEELTNKINEFNKKNKFSLYIFLLSILNILLSRYSEQEDIIIGTPVSGRTHADLESIYGMFVNTLCLRNYPKAENTFINFIYEVKKKVLECFNYQDYPFGELIDKIKFKRDFSRNPIFDVMLAVQNIDLPKLNLEELSITKYEYHNKTSKFDLTIEAYESSENIVLNLEYSTRLFKEDTINRLITHFKNIIKCVFKNPEIKIKDIDILGEHERNKIASEFNKTKIEYPENKTLIDIFEKQVKKIPGNTALIFNDKKMTYKELNNKSNQLARILREKGIGPDCIVGIMVERSFEMLIGLFGILKAGGAYLPIDPDYPIERIKFLLQDSNSCTLLTTNKLHKKIDIIDIIDLDDLNIYTGDTSDLPKICNAENLAYVIYTSGSTGKPKGVMVEHASILNTLYWMNRKFLLGSDDIILQTTTYTFDVSIWELFLWTLTGSSLCLLGHGDEKNPEIILDSIKKNKITMMHFVPSMLNIFLEYLENKKHQVKLSSLKTVIASGEKLELNYVNKFKKVLSGLNPVALHNIYGPTEAAIYACYYDCKMNFKENMIPIGKPIDNIQLYILDRNMQLVPIGIPGELYISGIGLARGYLNNPDLTDEKFIKYPYLDGKRLYKTGDLAKWLPDGNIEYLGRLDHQVKIRGFRIELGEIENILLKHESIESCVVVAREMDRAGKDLYAYIVFKNSNLDLKVQDLKSYLLKKLPEYMIPSYYIKLNELPLTGSGKINRKSLPEPDGSIQSITEYCAPSNDVENQLVEIWKSLLNIDRIGVYDNFFDLGGNSLLITKMYKNIEDLYPGKISIIDIFQNYTISELARFITKFDNEKEVIKLKNIYGNKFSLDFFLSNKHKSYNASIISIEKELFTNLKKVNKKHNIDSNIFLISIFCYLISEFSDDSNINLYTNIGSDNISMITFDISNINDLNHLFDEVKLMLKTKSEYNINDFKNSVIENGLNNEISVFISDNKVLLNEINNIFNLLLAIESNENNIDIALMFSSRLNKNMIDDFLRRYILLINKSIINLLN